MKDAYLKYKFLVVGYGVFGQSVVRFLENNKQDFILLKNDKEDVNLDEITHIIVSPGIKHCDLIERARQRLIPVMSDVDLLYYFYNTKQHTPTNNDKKIIIGVTGSCGKSTFIQQVAHVLMKKYPDKKVLACGNGIDTFLYEADIYVVEVFSFLLDKTNFCFFDFYIILNIVDTHKEWYESFELYKTSKYSPIVKGLVRKYFINDTGDNNNALLWICKEFNISPEETVQFQKDFIKPQFRGDVLAINDQFSIIHNGEATNLYAADFNIRTVKPNYVLMGGAKLNSIYPITIPHNIELLLCGAGGKQITSMFPDHKIIFFDTFKDAFQYIKVNITNFKGVMLYAPATQSFSSEFTNNKERNVQINKYILDLTQ